MKIFKIKQILNVTRIKTKMEHIECSENNPIEHGGDAGYIHTYYHYSF